MTESEPIKTCHRCKEPKPLSEFGKNKYYLRVGAKDGRAIYCKLCNWKATRFQRGGNQQLPPSRLDRKRMEIAARPHVKTDAEKILDAIAAGHRTVEQIAAHTRLKADHVGNRLADLAFTQSLVRIIRVGDEREFHLAA